jgi:hypothetical protein
MGNNDAVVQIRARVATVAIEDLFTLESCFLTERNMSFRSWVGICVLLASGFAPTYAQSAVTRRIAVTQQLKQDTASRSLAVAKSRSSAGALVGGVVGVTAGLILGHNANIGCSLGDVHCNGVTKQRKAMAITGVLLGAAGAGVGYLIGKAWPARSTLPRQPPGSR